MILNENLHSIKDEIADIQSKQNLGHFVEIVAATKTRSFQTINDIYECGVRHIGENRIQEAYQKFGPFDSMPNITKRFIGHLQTNKVNKCLELFDTIDSVDSIKLAEKINNRLIHLKKRIPILLEINTSGDKNKKGFSPEINEDFFSIFNLENIEIMGLMTMGPLSQGEKERIFAMERAGIEGATAMANAVRNFTASAARMEELNIDPSNVQKGTNALNAA